MASIYEYAGLSADVYDTSYPTPQMQIDYLVSLGNWSVVPVDIDGTDVEYFTDSDFGAALYKNTAGEYVIASEGSGLEFCSFHRD